MDSGPIDDKCPSEEEVAQAVNTLRKLKPSLLSTFDDLRIVGLNLFEREVKKKIFKDETAVDFLKEKSKHKYMLQKLQRIHDEVQMAHADHVESSTCAGINVIRETRTAEVNTKGVAALTTESAMVCLLESTTLSAPISRIGNSAKSELLENTCEISIDDINDIDSIPACRNHAQGPATRNKQKRGTGNHSKSNIHVISGKSDDFRMGGLGRSRGRKAPFMKDRVLGMYDEPDVESESKAGYDSLDETEGLGACDDGANGKTGSSGNIRRRGSVHFVPRHVGGTEASWLCYVSDDIDKTFRACALRTVVDLSEALQGMACPLVLGSPLAHPCTYVVGVRKQRWAYLGGEVEGLSGETAISVRLAFPESCTQAASFLVPPTEGEDGVRVGSSEDLAPIDISETSQNTTEGQTRDFVVPPIGSFRRHCNICKQPYAVVHPFYHQLCGRCGDFNLQKRLQTAPMSGFVCLVTGGRVRIGYQICLKLLRAGATVITTTRWPKDAALRYSHEHDFLHWKENLRIDELELSDTEAVEEYCRALCDRLPRLHVLINNAAQTITRPTEWKHKMSQLEVDTTLYLSRSAKEVLRLMDDTGSAAAYGTADVTTAASSTASQSSIAEEGGEEGVANSSIISVQTQLGSLRRSRASDGAWITLDESGQPLDLSGTNSWSRRLADVGKKELIETMLVNAIAPFLLCGLLKPLLSPRESNAQNDGGSSTAAKANLDSDSGVGKTDVDETGTPPPSIIISTTSSTTTSTTDSTNTSTTTSAAALTLSSPSTAGNDSPCTTSTSDPTPGSDTTSAVSKNSTVAAVAGHIVNVNALEGKFNVGKKSTGHPHTNMAKAALNMLTLTSAREYARSSIYMSSVDTGWVTDMSPGGLGGASRAHETFVGPPLDDEDGAARVLDPVFSFINSAGAVKMYGHFYKDYMKASW